MFKLNILNRKGRIVLRCFNFTTYYILFRTYVFPHLSGNMQEFVRDFETGLIVFAVCTGILGIVIWDKFFKRITLPKFRSIKLPEKTPFPAQISKENNSFMFDVDPDKVIIELKKNRMNLSYNELLIAKEKYRFSQPVVLVIRNLMKPWERSWKSDKVQSWDKDKPLSYYREIA